MSDTHHRKHLSKSERSKRGGHLDREHRERPLKTEKQKRSNARSKLRKEFLT
jgi:hypothetical protein